MLRDALSLLFKQVALLPQTVTADQAGTAVDLQSNRSMAFVAQVGAPGDTLSGSVKFELYLQESDDNSTFAPCANADVDGAVSGAAQTGTFAIIDANAEASQAYATQYLGNKRYIKCSVNAVGTHSNGTPIAILAVEPNPEFMPQA